MPVITYDSTPMDAATKTELVHRLTAVAAEVTGTPAQFFSVVIHECDPAGLGFGGKTVVEIKGGDATK